MDRSIIVNDFPQLSLFHSNETFEASVELIEESAGVNLYRFSLKATEVTAPSPVTIRWRMPYINMKGVWRSGGVHDKRQRYDWELDHSQSRISVDAPVLSVFGHDDTNGITFACSDAMNLLEFNALLREEDNQLYCHLTFFSERHPAINQYQVDIRVDTRRVHFAKALQAVSDWWASYDDLKPLSIPPLASAPLYSTWYQFHQDLDEKVLLEECKWAKSLGYELIILDDGWQTMDNNRGYDYTGDWKPDRFPDMAGFVERVHELGMQFGLWFSVPFCGKKSAAYQRFKGKFLTENHRWAPVFDPRYADVRQYLIDTYVNALKDWKLDAFKLDFIDDFRVYPETELTLENGRDYANVNAAVDRLLTDVINALKNIKPDIVIEFRQQYVGPAMRKYGHMFRAFDCPNDTVSNRIRITDVKLLSGDTAVHSDPQTWHPDEPVALAALQVLNGFFGVPQMSVHLRHLRADHLAMVRFYNQYWVQHADIILNGAFVPTNPLGNYPVLRATKAGHTIIGVYDNVVINLNDDKTIDLLNASNSDMICVQNTREERSCQLQVWTCQGALIKTTALALTKGIVAIEIPKAGMARLS